MNLEIELEAPPVTYEVIDTWEGLLKGIQDIHEYLDLSKAKGDKERLAFDIETYLDKATRDAIDLIFYSKKRKKKVKEEAPPEAEDDEEESEEDIEAVAEDLPDYPVPYPVKNKDGKFDARVRLLQFGFNPRLIDHQLIFDLDKIAFEICETDEPSEQNYLHFYELVGSHLQSIFDRATIIGQNLKYEYAFMWKFFRCRIRLMRDLMLMAQVRYMGDKSKKHSLGELYALNILEDLFQKHTGKTHDEYKKFKKAEQKSPWYNLELSPNQLKYGAEDVKLVWLVFETLLIELTTWSRLHGEGVLNVVKLECELIKAIAKAEIRGFQMDLDYYWNTLKPRLIGWMEEAQAEANKIAMRVVEKKRSEGTKKDKRIWIEKIETPYNLNSSAQVAEILGPLASRLAKTKGGKPSCTADELMFLREEHEIVKWVLQYKRSAKLIGFFEGPKGYFKYTDGDGKVHGSINQIGQSDMTVASGRFSLSAPNLSNVPAQNSLCGVKVKELVKDAFVCEDGMDLVIHDYSQIELVLAAQLTFDEFLVACFRDGKDMHSETAKTIFKLETLPLKDTPDEYLRDWGKTIRFAKLFMMGTDKFMKDVYVKTEGGLDYILRGEEGKAEAMKVTDDLENLTPGVIAKRNEIEEDVYSEARRLKTLAPFKNGQPYFVGKTSVTSPKLVRTRSFCLDPKQKEDARLNPEDWEINKRVMYPRTGKISTWANKANSELREAARQAWNNEMQSAAANIFKEAIVAYDKECEELHEKGVIDEYREGMINFVHDEIISQYFKHNSEMMKIRIKQIMEETEGQYLTVVPPKASANMGRSWFSAK